jgi:hypothetical protein
MELPVLEASEPYRVALSIVRKLRPKWQKRSWRGSAFRGVDLLDLGMTPGPRIGELLHALQTAQVEGEIKTRSDAFNLLKTLEPTLEIR